MLAGDVLPKGGTDLVTLNVGQLYVLCLFSSNFTYALASLEVDLYKKTQSVTVMLFLHFEATDAGHA